MQGPPTDDRPGGPGWIDEWVFAAWTPDAALGVISGHRLIEGGDWYWSAVVHTGFPLLHLAEWQVIRRSDPFTIKAPEMWAEHQCVVADAQWAIGNEAFFVALDDPDEALGRAYGHPTPTAVDLEWYATDDPHPIALDAGAVQEGVVQEGVVHGTVEVAGRPTATLVECPARRWRRAVRAARLAPIELEIVVAHTGQRAPFAYPDGSSSDWVLTREGFRSRPARARAPAR